MGSWLSTCGVGLLSRGPVALPPIKAARETGAPSLEPVGVITVVRVEPNVGLVGESGLGSGSDLAGEVLGMGVRSEPNVARVGDSGAVLGAAGSRVELGWGTSESPVTQYKSKTFTDLLVRTLLCTPSLRPRQPRRSYLLPKRTLFNLRNAQSNA